MRREFRTAGSFPRLRQRAEPPPRARRLRRPPAAARLEAARGRPAPRVERGASRAAGAMRASGPSIARAHSRDPPEPAGTSRRRPGFRRDPARRPSHIAGPPFGRRCPSGGPRTGQRRSLRAAARLRRSGGRAPRLSRRAPLLPDSAVDEQVLRARYTYDPSIDMLRPMHYVSRSRFRSTPAANVVTNVSPAEPWPLVSIIIPCDAAHPLDRVVRGCSSG